MINLTGIKEADEQIQEELYLAGIELALGERSKGLVPYSITGKANDWKFERAWRYWIAIAEKGNGLPLEVATDMHERRYPIIGEGQPKSYGQVIRVGGRWGGPYPRECAFPNSEVLRAELKRMGKEFATNGELVELCNRGIIHGQRFVISYHIDTQPGLNEFARVLRKL